MAGLGVVGAGLATTGYVIAGVAGAQVGLATFAVCSMVLGCAYGLCLGQGLRDVERLAPLASRGTATGLFCVVSYSGFALPFVLNTYEDSLGASAPCTCSRWRRPPSWRDCGRCAEAAPRAPLLSRQPPQRRSPRSRRP
ncbi:hypothetical protein [Janibacter hoylei]|uniref:hypothetical protein n=1 Tax=Janibacter hoylei TaxID=364298 RepID=UPI0021A335F6|nr:hypothetical protein [Janibacter hoylei]MCT1617593.1 hypothetical protein [Janibacter hoylei]MCT2292808.1 hypothetical protein [Janibacter hoylei]